MTSQKTSLSRPGRLALLLAVAALTALAVAPIAGAARSAPRKKSAPRCGDGYKTGSKVIRKNGKAKRILVCRRTATSADAPAEPSVVPPGDTPPATTPPADPSPPDTIGDPEVQAAIGQGFSQNPLIPNQVTWHYSASATRTVTTDGVEQTESVPLPEGRLVFFVDGQLDCEIQAGGAITASACTATLPQLGAHEVETIFSGASSSTALRTDYIGRYPTSTDLQVSVEPTAPEYLDIGDNKYGFDQHAFEVGRLRISGSATPGGYPVFDCEGQPSGCLDPEVSLANHHGSVSVPLYAQHRLNSVAGSKNGTSPSTPIHPPIAKRTTSGSSPPNRSAPSSSTSSANPTPTSTNHRAPPCRSTSTAATIPSTGG